MSAIADLSTAGTGEEREGFIVFDTFRWRRRGGGGGGGGGQRGRCAEKLVMMGAANRGLGFIFCPYARLARERLLHRIVP